MFDSFIVVLQLQEALTEEEMTFDQVLVHVESPSTILT